MKAWLQQLLFDWVFVLLYRLLQGFLNLVSFIESFFDIFAGTAKIFYKGDAEFLLNVFFGHDSVTNAFWAMALIAVVLAFAFCIIQMARKATDISGTVKQSVGQILSNFFRCMLIIVLLNAGTVAVINITNVLLDRINFALENAAVLNQSEQDKTFSEQEYATMTKILATVANYSVNPSADSRYNVNSCFNAIRPDLLSLHSNGFFNYDYPLDDNGHYTWQGALALLATSADLTTDLNLDTYYEDVSSAFSTVSKEISNYSDFAPIQSAHFATPGTIDTDDLIFLIVGMEAANNSMYNTGDFYDSIRKGYISGQKSYNDMDQVRKDFDIWDMDYMVGYISCITFILILAICIFTFIVRIFNILLLYITAPLFVSSMPLDDGSKWNNWIQAFIIQLFSGFGLVIAMRLYLIIIPIVISSDLVFFAGEGTGIAILNHMAQLLMVLGGAWAVLQAGGVITGILAGNPGMAAIQQEGRMGGMVTSWAMRAPRAAMHAAGKIGGAAWSLGKYVANTGTRRLEKAEKKADLAARKERMKKLQSDAAKKKLQDKNKGAGGSNARAGIAAPPPVRSRDTNDIASTGGSYSDYSYASSASRSRDTNDITSDAASSAAASIPAGQRSTYWRSQIANNRSGSSGGGSVDPASIPAGQRADYWRSQIANNRSGSSGGGSVDPASIPAGQRADYWRSQSPGGSKSQTPPPPPPRVSRK